MQISQLLILMKQAPAMYLGCLELEFLPSCLAAHTYTKRCTIPRTSKVCIKLKLQKLAKWPREQDSIIIQMDLIYYLITLYYNQDSLHTWMNRVGIKSYRCYTNLQNFYGLWDVWLSKVYFTLCIPNQRDSVCQVYCHVTVKISAIFFYSQYLEAMLVNVLFIKYKTLEEAI
jgi:hypothetical protein